MTATKPATIALLLATIAAPVARGDDPPRPAILGEATFIRVIGLADRIKDPADRAHTLGVIARAQAGAGDKIGAGRTFAMAVGLVDGLTLDQMRYSPHILAWVGHAQKDAGDLPGAIASYRKAAALVDRPSKADPGSKFSHFCNIILYQVEAGDVEGARATLEKARRFLTKPDEDGLVDKYGGLWTLMLRAGLGEFDVALGAIANDQANPDELSPQFKDDVLAAIARAAGRAGPAEGRGVLARALEVAATTKDPHSIPGPLLAIAEASAQVGDFDLAARAVRTFRAVPLEPFLRDTAGFNLCQVLAEVAKAQAGAGRRDDAKATLAEAASIAAGMEAGSSRSSASRFVRLGWVVAGEYDRALRPIEGDEPFATEILSAIAHAQEGAGDEAAARRTRGRVLAEAEARLRDLEPDVRKVVDDANGPRHAPPTFETRKARAASQVAVAKADLGDFAGALAIARTVADRDARRSALAAVAMAQGASGDVDAAVDWIRRLDDAEDVTRVVDAFAYGLTARAAKTSRNPR